MGADDDEIRRLRERGEMLEAIVEDRRLLDRLDEAARRALVEAAGRVSRPERAEQRVAAKARRRARRRAARDHDLRRLEQTGSRRLRAAPVFAPPPPLPRGDHPADEPPGALHEERKCYVCKAPFATLHHFHDRGHEDRGPRLSSAARRDRRRGADRRPHLPGLRERRAPLRSVPEGLRAGPLVRALASI